MPNERLSEAMSHAGLSRKALARRVHELSARRGRIVRCDHTSVSRRLDGTNPREGTAQLIAEVLSQAMGRPVTLDEIGLTASQSIDSRTGLEYESSGGQGFGTLETLWDADIQQVRLLTSTQPESHAWSEAALKWLLRAESGGSRREPDSGAGQAIGAGDVESLRATIDAFARLDDTSYVA